MHDVKTRSAYEAIAEMARELHGRSGDDVVGRVVGYAVSAIPGVRIIGTAKEKAGVLSFVVDDPPMSALDVGGQHGAAPGQG